MISLIAYVLFVVGCALIVEGLLSIAFGVNSIACEVFKAITNRKKRTEKRSFDDIWRDSW